MIARIQGVLLEAFPPKVVIDVHGIGYEVVLPISAFDRLPRCGEKVTVLTHFHVREDTQQLYGFLREEERELFRLLLRVSGIGPRVAIGILGAAPPAAFKSAVVSGDVRMLSRLPGIGKKTAERLVVELRDRIGVADAWRKTAPGAEVSEEDRRMADTVMALLALGYRQTEAHRAATRAVETLGSDAPVDALIREALRTAAGRISS